MTVSSIRREIAALNAQAEQLARQARALPFGSELRAELEAEIANMDAAVNEARRALRAGGGR